MRGLKDRGGGTEPGSVHQGRGARGEGGGNAPAMEVACQAPAMPDPALEHHPPPPGLSQGRGTLRRVPLTPPASWPVPGYCPIPTTSQPRVSPKKVPSVSWSQVTLPHLGTEGTSSPPGAPVLSLGLAWALPGRLSLPHSSDLQFPPSPAPIP